MTDMVEVRVRDCACPDTPHPDGDLVYLRPVLGLIGGLEAQRENTRAINDALLEVLGRSPSDKDIEALTADDSAFAQRVAAVANELLILRWVPVFIRHGAAGWNWIGNDGRPVPFDVDVLLGDYELGRPVADAAADQYSDALMRPLVAKLAMLSPRLPTEPIRPAIRRKPGSTRKPRSSSSRRGSGGQRSATGR